MTSFVESHWFDVVYNLLSSLFFLFFTDKLKSWPSRRKQTSTQRKISVLCERLIDARRMRADAAFAIARIGHETATGAIATVLAFPAAFLSGCFLDGVMLKVTKHNLTYDDFIHRNEVFATYLCVLVCVNVLLSLRRICLDASQLELTEVTITAALARLGVTEHNMSDLTVAAPQP